MLDLARERLPGVEVVESDLRGDWPTAVGDGFDLVVSANTIHHVEGEGKRDVYANAFRVLAPGGRLLNGERLAVEPALFEHYRTLWQALHERIGMDPLPEDWTYERYSERLGEVGDVPELLHTQLAWLREIGFDPVTTFWKEADRSVFGGVRP